MLNEQFLRHFVKTIHFVSPQSLDFYVNKTYNILFRCNLIFDIYGEIDGQKEDYLFVRGFLVRDETLFYILITFLLS